MQPEDLNRANSRDDDFSRSFALRGNERGSEEIIYVVDDGAIVRQHLTRVLQSAGHAVINFSSGEDFLADATPKSPGCVLLDHHLGGLLDGSAVLSRMNSLGWMLPVICITAHATVRMAVDVLKSGADDFLIKPLAPDILIPAVEKSLARSREMFRKHRDRVAHCRLVGRLSEREREVLAWIVSGMLNKQTAMMLGITERTVKAHRANIMEKLGVSSLPELVRIADRAGISPPNSRQTFSSIGPAN